MPITRNAHDWDAWWIICNLRQADHDEVMASTGKEPAQAIFDALDASTVKATVFSPEGEPIALGGVVGHPLDPLVGVVWLVASNSIHHHRIHFLRESRKFLPTLLGIWPILTNAADERNTAHLEWLTWLGATFTKRIPAFGVERRPFQEFILCASR